MKRIRLLAVLAVLVTSLVACSSAGSGSRPLEINGVWGGVLSYADGDFAVFAMDVSTTVSGGAGTVSGYGLMTDGYYEVPLTISGTTRRGTAELILTDLSGDRVYLSGNQEGRLIRGSWNYPSEGVSGTFRMSNEDDIDLLSRAQVQSSSAGRLADLFGGQAGPGVH